MNDNQIVSLISLVACLVLAVSSFRSRQLGLGATAKLAMAWIAIFLAVTAVIAAINPGMR